MNLEKMLKSSGVLLPPKKQQKSYVNGELTDSELESVMAHYAKQELGRVSVFLSLVLCLISVPLLMIITFLLSLMAVFVMLGIFVKDLVVELIQLCSGPFSLGRKRHRVI